MRRGASTTRNGPFATCIGVHDRTGRVRRKGGEALLGSGGLDPGELARAAAHFAPSSARRVSRSPHGTAANASRCSERGEGVADLEEGVADSWDCVADSRDCVADSRECVAGLRERCATGGPGFPTRGERFLASRCRRTCCRDRCPALRVGCPTSPHRSPPSSYRFLSWVVGRRSESVGLLREDAAQLGACGVKPSELALEPCKRGEK
jgi:hypothetical protein